MSDVAAASSPIGRTCSSASASSPTPPSSTPSPGCGAGPEAERISIVHGDLRFGNLLHDEGRLTALLDWEMVHLGDPVEDLGWVYRRCGARTARCRSRSSWPPTRRRPAGPVDPDRLRWYQLFSEVKHSVISLTAARSFHERRTPNLRLADRAATVSAFMTRFLELIGWRCCPPHPPSC